MENGKASGKIYNKTSAMTFNPTLNDEMNIGSRKGTTRVADATYILRGFSDPVCGYGKSVLSTK
jgi:hypothetical protein